MKQSSIAVGLVVLALLTACAQTGGDRSEGAAPGRDRLTESDETPVSRRARVRLELASAYFGRGQLTTALDEVKLAISADPKLVGAFNLKGLIYSGLGDDALAEESFKHALQLDPRDADTLQNFGWHLCQRKRYAEADGQFERALQIPFYANVQRTLVTQGACQARNGELEKAEATLIKGYEIDIGDPIAGYNLADVLYRRGQYERSRFYLRRINNNPELTNPQTLWLGARIEKKLGNTSGTQLLGRQLSDRFPKSAESMAFEKGQFDE